MKSVSIILVCFLAPGAAVEFDPDIATVIARVSPDSVEHFIASLSGEIGVTIEGQPDSLPCRFAYSPGGLRAALWIAEQMRIRGIDADTVSFIPAELSDVELLPSGKGYACGFSGGWQGYRHGFFLTENAGASWEPVEAIEIDRLSSMAVHSRDSIWLVSERGRIMRLVSGTWEVTAYGGPGLFDLAWVDNLEGWAVGDSGIVVHTTDAWGSITKTYPVEEDLRFVDFSSTEHGWIGSAAKLWSTTDGAETWFELEHPIDRIRGMEFTDSVTGFIVGEKDILGAVYVTEDAGLSWIPLIDTLEYVPATIEISSEGELWVAGENGLLVASSDEGQTWVRREIPSDFTINAIDVLPGNECVAVGIKDIFYSEDGVNWQRPDTTNLGLMWNVYGTHPGEDSTLILLTAHYDARSEDFLTYTPGADDNASGVACVLETARVLSEEDFAHSLGFVFFAGEEVGLQGSRRFVTGIAGDSITAVLNADMFAYDGNEDDVAEINANPHDPFAPVLTGMFTDVIEVYGIEGITFRTHIADPRYNSDHYYFWQEQIPALYLGEDREDRNPFYHQIGDRLSAIDLDYTTAGIKAAAGWAASVAETELLEEIAEPIFAVTGNLEIRMTPAIVNRTGYVEVKANQSVTPVIYDALGRKVRALPAIEPSDGLLNFSFDIGDMTTGVYWIGVQAGTCFESTRFMVIQ